MQKSKTPHSHGDNAAFYGRKWWRNGLESFGYMPGTDATGTHLNASNRPLTDCFNFLQIRVPSAAGFVVCMADIVPEAWTFTANLTYFRHDYTSSNAEAILFSIK